MRVPGSKRTARAPDGRRWRVGRRWLTASRTSLRLRRKRERERDDGSRRDPSDVGKRHGDDSAGGSQDTSGDNGGGWLDRLDGDGGGGFGVGDLLDGDSLAIGLVLVVVLGLLFFLVFPLLEAVIVVVLLAASVASRVVLRRPWRVEARLLDGDPPQARAHWDVVGWRRSGQLTREVAEQLAATGELPPTQSAEPLERAT